jgi:hypothetical protein
LSVFLEQSISKSLLSILIFEKQKILMIENLRVQLQASVLI